MEDTELASIVRQRVDDSLGASGDQLSSDRIDALKRYRGEPYGDEVEGRSKVVTHDVAEAVDSLMPPLLKVFLAGEKVVMFEPVGPEDEQVADQATDYVNHTFLQKNDGFQIVYTTLKDGLLFKTGVAKVWWDDTPEETQERYQGLSPDELAILQATEDVDVEEEEESDYGVNVRVTRRGKKGKCCVAAIPPEEFLIDRYATKINQDTPDGPLFTAHRSIRPVYDVIQEFPDKEDEIMSAAGATEDADRQGEKRERHSDESLSNVDNFETDDSTQPIWIIEAYVRVDYDGDGIAELRKVTCAGESGYVVLDNEAVDDNPFAAWSPILMPHKFHGMSVEETIADLQRIKTSLLRGMLNNMYFTNEPMTYVNRRAKVDIDMLLNRRVGGVVEGDGSAQEAVQEWAVPPMFQHGFPMLEYIDTLREQRTGVTRYSQGLDAEALNKTARGIQIIQDASQQRQELIARVYAEIFMKRLFSLLLKCVTKYQSAPDIIRLRGKWVPMDPRTWRNHYDMTVTVGLGTGNRDQQAAHAMNILNVQKELLMGGKDNLVTDANVYNTLEKLIESIGWKTAEPYFVDPQNAPQQPKPPPQDPKVVEIQGKQQLQGQKEQMDHQFRMAKLEKDGAAAMYKARADAQIEAWKAEQEAIRKGWIAENEADINLAKSIDDIDIKRLSVETDNELKSDMHETNKKIAGEKGSEKGNSTKVVMSDGTEMKGMNDAFKEIAGSMKENSDAMQKAIQEMNKPKQVSLTRDKSGRVSGGKVT